MKRIVSTWLVVLLVGLGVTSFLYAQGNLDPSKGQLAVDVLDSSGAVIQNAKVTLNGPTGAQKAATDTRGHVVFYNLIPGNYAVKVEFEGFRTFEAQDIGVAASQRPTVQARMEPGAVTETVQVTETAAKIDTASTTTGATITDQAMTNLPVARNIASLMSLAPGVADGGGTGASNPSISGASGLENQYVIDGINATDSGYGAFGVYSNRYGSMGTGVNFDFVKEVQVKSGGFEAQYGQALGGIVNVVTHSGTNEIHGALYAYSAPRFTEGSYKQVNDVREQFLSETHAQSAYDFGLNIGGPAIKDRLFWYGSIDPSFTTRVRMAPKALAMRSVGELPWSTRSYNWVAKLNFEISPNHHLEGTAFGDPSRGPMAFHGSTVRDDTNVDGASSSLVYGTRNWAVKYNGLLGPNTLLNGVFAWNHTYFGEDPKENAFEIRNVATGIFSGGMGHMQDNSGDNKQWSGMFTRNLTLLGGHQIDIGYGYNQVQYANISYYTGGDWPLPNADGIPADMVGVITHGAYFYLYPDRTIGGVTYPEAYRLVRGNYSAPAVSTDTRYHSAFVQDAWQINRYVTAKLGVRWEEQKLMGNLSTYTFTGNWAPRIGFIIDPTGNRKTKLFANWGKFFEKVPQDMAVRAMSGEMAYMNGYFSSLPPTEASFIPGSKFSPYNTLPTILAAGTKTGYQDEIVAGAEHEFPGGIVVTGRFIHRSLKRILEDISGTTVEGNLAGVPQQSAIANPNMSLDLFTNPEVCTVGVTPNCDPSLTYDDPVTGLTYGPFTTDAGAYVPDGIPDTYPDPRRVYKAFEFTVDKRFASNWSLMANYRLAKLFGNYEGFFRNDNGQADPGITSLFDFMWSPLLADQFRVGVLPTDRRHIANIYANYLFKSRLNIGFGWTVESGTPISKLGAHPDYGNEGEVPIGGRGAFGRTPTQNYSNLRVDYRLPIKSDTRKLHLAADLFNMFNQKTMTDTDQNYETAPGELNPDFLRPLSYHRPFYARFSLRFEF